MDGAVVIYVAAIAVLVCVSAFFSMTETAFTSVSDIKLKKMANDGDVRAQKALKVINGYDKFLITTLIGNNLVNIAATSIATIVFAILLGAETGALASTVVMTILLLSVSEITPKAYAKRNPEKVCIMTCSVVNVIVKVLTPLSWAFTKLSNLMGESDDNTMTEDELEVMIDEIQGEGVLEKSESELIKSAMRLDDITIDKVLVPRVDIVGVEVNSDIDVLEKEFIRTGYSRIPVFDDTIDDIVGFVYVKTYYNKVVSGVEFSIQDIMMPVKYFPDTITVATALSDLQKSKVHMAVVLDSYGGTEGIITLEDLLEELVGDIWDESDNIQEDVSAMAGGKYLVKGDADIFDAMERMGVHFDPEDYAENSMSGFVMYKLGRVPSKGDVVELDNVVITAGKVVDHRMKDCEVVLKDQEDES